MTRTESSPRYASDAQCWDAVVARDGAATGAFYYAVTTTGVYCRPGCPARLPRREHVVFYPNREAAERAGFRPCRRCHPRAPALARQRAAAVAKACRLIETAAEVPTLDALASATGLSRFHFHRLFKATTGITPAAYAKACRARRVRDALSDGKPVTTAVYAAGFGSSSRFYAASAGALGMSPSRFRAGAPGEVIRFAVGACTLGSILVAATQHGVCAISLGDDPAVLVHALEDRFSKARLISGDAAFERLVATVVGFIEAPPKGLDLPLDIRGTAFQLRVWNALRKIPVGTTASYAQVADQIGAPGSARAVAMACAANPLAVAIPCHRVVRRDGALSGYRWGVERKRALLEREAIAVKRHDR